MKQVKNQKKNKYNYSELDNYYGEYSQFIRKPNSKKHNNKIRKYRNNEN